MAWTDRPVFGPKRILIMGAGEVGVTVANVLVSQGNTVHILDRAPGALDRLPKAAIEKRRIVPVVGDGTSLDDLIRAGVQGVDVFMSLTTDDVANVLAAQVAKHEFNVEVVCRVDDPDLQSMYKESGLIAISGTSLLAHAAVQAVTA